MLPPTLSKWSFNVKVLDDNNRDDGLVYDLFKEFLINDEMGNESEVLMSHLEFDIEAWCQTFNG